MLVTLAHAATAGLVLGTCDALLAYLCRTGAPFPWALRLQAFASSAWILALAYLVTLGAIRAIAYLNAWAPDAGALARAISLGLLAALIDIAYFRFDLARGDLYELHSSATIGLLVCAVAYPTLARQALPERKDTRGPIERAIPIFLLAALFLTSRFVEPPGRPKRDAPLVDDHMVERVILIVVDTLRADAVSCSSERAAPTPAIDRLAATSLRFENARAPGAWTLPSMASIMTGVSPLVHRTVTRTSRLPDSIPTLAEAMRDAGYRTAAIGHNFVLSSKRALDRGFDEYDFRARAELPGHSLGLLMLARKRQSENATERSASEVNRLAFRWLEKHRDDDFFLWLHYYDPHVEFAPEESFRPPGPPPPRSSFVFDHDDLERVRGGYEVPTPEQRRWVRRLYDGEVRYVDQQLGALFAKLRELDLFDGSLIVLTSDHGEEFWEHEGVEHGHTVYEELVRVPLIVKRAGQTTGIVEPRPVSLESILPTVLTSCGIPYDADRLSAAPLLAQQPVSRDLLTTGNLYYQDRVAVLFDGWKYIRFFLTGVEELYDLANDPGERTSLVALTPPELAVGRERCDALLASAAKLREAFGVSAGERVTLSQEELDALQKIGYAAEE